jgi:PIN domain nuclease of toxin-antitoxin system
MVSYVLDASAVLRYLHQQAGAERVAEIIKAHLSGTCVAMICAPHWGEIAGITCKLYGKREVERVLVRLASFGLRIVAADAERSVRAALLKVETDLPYVDAFGVELAAQIGNCILVTADFDFKVASRDVKIEFLPAK